MGIFFPLSLKKFEKPSYLFSLCLPQNLEAESENKQGCQKYIWPICICYTWENLGTVQQLPNHPSPLQVFFHLSAARCRGDVVWFWVGFAVFIFFKHII